VERNLANVVTDQEYCLLSHDIDSYQRFGEFHCLHLRDRRLAATDFFEAMVPIYQSTRRQEANFSFRVQLLIVVNVLLLWVIISVFDFVVNFILRDFLLFYLSLLHFMCQMILN
jgi:hypothetical protein